MIVGAGGITVSHREESMSIDQQSAKAPAALTDRVAFRLRQATARVEAMGAERLVSLALDGRQYGVLTVLGAVGPQTQQQLARALHVDRAVMVRLIGDLERRGLARRDPHATDRRAYAVTSTPAGRRLQRRAEGALLACEREFLAPLAGGEREALAAFLSRLVG